MREIKFNFWDKSNKKIWDWEIAKTGLQLAMFFGDKQFIPLQYTGLKDKNGKEIWEGDIVWSEGHRLQFITEYRISMGGFMFCSEVLSMGVGQNSHSIEIIGNIYENPDLIKEKK